MLLAIAAAYVDVFGASGAGLRFFHNICILNVLLISASGISYFVSAVTEEKEAGTLALLRLAGVTPLAIILGKSTSRLISSLMLLMVQIPFTILAITLGGVLWQQIAAAYVALAAWMAFVSTIALFSSVRCQTPGRAAGLAGAMLLLFFIVGPAVTMGVPLLPPGWMPPVIVAGLEKIAVWQFEASVFRRLTEILEVQSATPDLTSPQLWWNLGTAIVLFLISTVMFDRWSPQTETAMHGESPTTRRLTVGRCWSLSLTWKDFVFFTGGRLFLASNALICFLLIAGFAWYQYLTTPWLGIRLNGDMAWTAFVTLSILLQVEILLYSSGILFAEVRQSTLSSLAMLPVSPVRILLEKAAACVIAVLPAIFCLLIVFLMDPSGISGQLSATMIMSWLTVVLLSSHLTILLSLYTRWAALPLAILLTAGSFLCCPMLTMTTFLLTDIVARSHNFRGTLLLGCLVNLTWLWLFVLLPIELEIVKRWKTLGQQ